LIQKGQNHKSAYHLVVGILVIQKPMVSKVMAWSHPNKQTRCVSHCGLAIYIKTYRKVKQELWKLKHFTMKNVLVKKSSKENQNPSRYYNSTTNLKLQHKPKYHL